MWPSVHVLHSGPSHLPAPSCWDCGLLMTHVSDESLCGNCPLRKLPFAEISCLGPNYESSPGAAFIALRHFGPPDIVGWHFSVVGGCPEHCGAFSSISDLHPLDARSSPPPVAPTKNVSRHCQAFPGGKTRPPSWVKDHCLYWMPDRCSDRKPVPAPIWAIISVAIPALELRLGWAEAFSAVALSFSSPSMQSPFPDLCARVVSRSLPDSILPANLPPGVCSLGHWVQDPRLPSEGLNDLSKTPQQMRHTAKTMYLSCLFSQKWCS